MAQTLEAIVILLIVWQLMSRLRDNYRISTSAKSELKEAIDDARNRLPSTGLFKLFKRDILPNENIGEPDLRIERTIVRPKSEKKEDHLEKDKV